MTKKGIPKKFNKVLEQVPPDYYASGVKSNIFQKFWHQKKWDKLETHLKNHKKSRLLDVGCADGTTTLQILEKFPDFKITGIDAYKKAVNYARGKNSKADFVHGDAHSLPFKNSHFDVVTAIEVLEHLHYPEIALSEIRRVLKPKGSFVIIQDTNSLLFRSVWWAWTKWRGSVWENSHISCVEPKILISNLKKGGFYVEKYDVYNLGMEIIAKTKKR